MNSSNLRTGRTSLKNHVYHVTFCTQDRQYLFTDFHCARLVINSMRQLVSKNQVESFAWVIMPDHVHWLFQLVGEQSISDIVKQLKGSSAFNINKMFKHDVHVWQSGFHDHGIRFEENLIATARYIVANPLRAGLVKHIGDYPHWDAKWLE